MAFHEGVPGALGGYLGVDIFFVLSGYLITDLLVAQRARRGRMDLRGFWTRRARRLLPALAVLLVTVTAAVAVIEPGQLGGLRPALGAAATYSSNWYQALHHVSYFATFGPPAPLQHLWSLAIEEQFYLIWPLVLGLVLLLAETRRARASIAWAGAAASALLMAVIYTPGADPSLVYYGTDTHATALLVGSAIALTCPLARLVTAPPELARRLDFLGMAGLAVLGRQPGNAWLWMVEAAAAIGLAAVSWKWIETPIMRDGFRATFRTCRRVLAESVTAARRSPVRALPVLATVAAATVACTAGYGVLRPPRSDLSGLMQQVAQGERISAATRSSQALWNASGYAQQTPGQTPTPVAAPSPGDPGPPKIHGRQVTAIGDSVMLAAAQQLHSALPGIYIDAQVSRQMAAGLAEVSSLATEGLLRHVVIMGLGTNGTVSSGQIRDLLAEIGPSRKLVLVNTYEARPWEHADNSVISAAARRYPNVVLANWRTAIAHRTNLLWGDGVHPRPPGARLYAKVVAAAVQATGQVTA